MHALCSTILYRTGGISLRILSCQHISSIIIIQVLNSVLCLHNTGFSCSGMLLVTTSNYIILWMMASILSLSSLTEA